LRDVFAAATAKARFAEVFSMFHAPMRRVDWARAVTVRRRRARSVFITGGRKTGRVEDGKFVMIGGPRTAGKHPNVERSNVRTSNIQWRRREVEWRPREREKRKPRITRIYADQARAREPRGMNEFIAEDADHAEDTE
jgi:hypothetical protein